MYNVQYTSFISHNIINIQAGSLRASPARRSAGRPAVVPDFLCYFRVVSLLNISFSVFVSISCVSC